MSAPRKLLAITTLATALSAGTFFAFSVAINPAFSKLSDEEYITGMQAINRDIQNPLFFLVFFGAAVLLPLTAYLFHRSGDGRTFKLLLAASVLYTIGTVGVTAAANVPLNERLDKVNVATSSTSERADQRSAYVSPWNAWHAVRTVTAVAALSAVIVAYAFPSRKDIN